MAEEIEMNELNSVPKEEEPQEEDLEWDGLTMESVIGNVDNEELADAFRKVRDRMIEDSTPQEPVKNALLEGIEDMKVNDVLVADSWNETEFIGTEDEVKSWKQKVRNINHALFPHYMYLDSKSERTYNVVDKLLEETYTTKKKEINGI